MSPQFNQWSSGNVSAFDGYKPRMIKDTNRNCLFQTRTHCRRDVLTRWDVIDAIASICATYSGKGCTIALCH